MGAAKGVSDQSYMSLGYKVSMAPHSSALAWKNPWTEEPGRQIGRASCRERVSVAV